MGKKRIEVTDVNYNQKHLIDIDENDIPSPSGDIDPEKLVEVLQGSETIVVDLAEDNEHVEVHLDADVVAKVDNSMQLPVAPPLKTALVGVNNAGSQTMVGVGDGLEVNNGVLKVAGGVYSLTSDQTEENINIQDGDEYLLSSTRDNGTIFNLPQGTKLVGVVFIDSSDYNSIISGVTNDVETRIEIAKDAEVYIKRVGNMILVSYMGLDL